MDAPPPTSPLLWRIVARLVDVVALGWLATVVLIEIDRRLLGGDPLGREPGRLEIDGVRSVVLLVVVLIVYEVVPVAHFGATLGKALFGLRVVRTEGTSIGTAGALLRAAVLYGPAVVATWAIPATWLVLVVSIVLHPWGRGLHDLAAGSEVRSVRGLPGSGG